MRDKWDYRVAYRGYTYTCGFLDIIGRHTPTDVLLALSVLREHQQSECLPLLSLDDPYTAVV